MASNELSRPSTENRFVHHFRGHYFHDWGGQIAFTSTVGKGTRVKVSLPLAPPPSWFAEYLYISTDTQVVVLDDDLSIHSIWDERFAHIAQVIPKVEHFSTPAQLRAFCGTPPSLTTLFLIDYELLGHDLTGVELIRELKICEQTVLVTSRSEESSVRDACADLNLKLLPKPLASAIPLRFDPLDADHPPDAVLIDNDTLVHEIWRDSAHQAGKVLRIFGRPELFLKNAKDIPQATPLYIDYCLDSPMSGEDVAQQAKAMGFQTVYLSTGLDADRFSHHHWLSGVRDKDPPF